ncbi:MAG TPA: phospholipase D-like domain-containing protein [Dissulfurispiraceae bacterium]|nr:phospholipase D-like domain-containing protein [Dissulfurispiraceae bacterium]
MIPLIGRDYETHLVASIRDAKHSIDVAMYDWRWYLDQPLYPVQSINRALVEAVRRGVIVRALLDKDDIIPLLKSAGINAKKIPDLRRLHAKLVLIDRTKLIIGSHNLTRNALTHNVEASIAIDLPSPDNRFTLFFSHFFGN